MLFKFSSFFGINLRILVKSLKLLSNSLILSKNWALLLSNTKFSGLIEIAFEIILSAFKKFFFSKVSLHINLMHLCYFESIFCFYKDITFSVSPLRYKSINIENSIEIKK